MNTFKRRWRGFTKGEVSERMRALSRKQKEKMTPEARHAKAKMMVEARERKRHATK